MHTQFIRYTILWHGVFRCILSTLQVRLRLHLQSWSLESRVRYPSPGVLQNSMPRTFNRRLGVDSTLRLRGFKLLKMPDPAKPQGPPWYASQILKPFAALRLTDTATQTPDLRSPSPVVKLCEEESFGRVWRGRSPIRRVYVRMGANA